jgi:hypothetical protein
MKTKKVSFRPQVNQQTGHPATQAEMAKHRFSNIFLTEKRMH